MVQTFCEVCVKPRTTRWVVVTNYPITIPKKLTTKKNKSEISHQIQPNLTQCLCTVKHDQPELKELFKSKPITRL